VENFAASRLFRRTGLVTTTGAGKWASYADREEGWPRIVASGAASATRETREARRTLNLRILRSSTRNRLARIPDPKLHDAALAAITETWDRDEGGPATRAGNDPDLFGDQLRT